MVSEKAKMRAITASKWGSSGVLKMDDERLVPMALAGMKDSGKGKLLLRVRACSLSPSDYRMLTGDASLIKKPKDGFPYVPGGDVCGVVLEVGKGVDGFKKGDEVVATWDIFGVGGLAEYAVVDSRFAALKPPAISAAVGAAAANSATHAMKAVELARVSEGDRVLVLGGSGGVGSCVVQLAKAAGAAFVAATTTAGPLVASLGADRVIDYTQEDWAKLPEFEEAPFDVIIDCAVGLAAWQAAQRSSVLPRGRFVAVVLKEWRIVVKNPLQVRASLAAPMLPAVQRSSPTCFLFSML